MSKPYQLLLLCVATLWLCSCRDGEIKRMPDTLPDLEGNITAVSRPAKVDEGAVATITVKAIEGIDVQIPEANVIVTEETLIEDSDGQVLSPDVLREGMEVGVWIENEMRESFPMQAEAVAIKISELE